jgi:hypothetical protein
MQHSSHIFSFPDYGIRNSDVHATYLPQNAGEILQSVITMISKCNTRADVEQLSRILKKSEVLNKKIDRGTDSLSKSLLRVT